VTLCPRNLEKVQTGGRGQFKEPPVAAATIESGLRYLAGTQWRRCAGALARWSPEPPAHTGYYGYYGPRYYAPAYYGYYGGGPYAYYGGPYYRHRYWRHW
jgi:hypothetical protein